MTKTTEAKWRRLIAAQERSGQTAREFAAARGIPVGTLYWWRSKLRRDATQLVPVDVIERDVVLDRRRSDSPTFELEVDHTMTLRIPANFDEAELRRLVRALRC
jgi:transposase-like protein